MTASISLASMAQAFPVVTASRTLVCLDLEASEHGPSLLFELSVHENGEVIHSMQQPVAIRGLGTEDPHELARRVRERILLPRFEFATPFLLLARPYAPVPRPLGVEVDEAIFRVYDALSEQAHDTGFDARFDRLDVWPAAPRTLYYLVTAEALGGNGLESFLGQAPFEEILGVRDALEAAGCTALTERLRQGLSLAWSEGAEFTMQTDEDWIESEGLPVPDGDERPWERIDGHEEGRTYWLVGHELRPKRLAYYLAHEAEIVGK